jgi:Zn-dependent M28 family amino/carboxypeptidase
MQIHGDSGDAQLGMAVVKPIVGHNVLFSGFGSSGKGYGVLAAHYDHLGYGGENSLFRGEPMVHYGADDNASGVATMLEVAKRLASTPLEDHVLFCGFSGEEKGLWGSNHFCEEPTVALDSIRYMLNLDMVGRLRGDTLAVYGTGTSPRWMEILEACNEEGFVLVPSESGVGPSDHTSFYLEGIPVLHFFTGQHPDYHRPSDTPDKLNYQGMLRIARYVERVMRALDREIDWEFTATKDQDEDSTPRFKVTLGVVPDYLYSGEGMRIDGVTDGRPAAMAGLKRGDVVVRMDTIQVVDMMSYMTGLSLFEEGMATEVEIERGGDRLTVNVIWD